MVGWSRRNAESSRRRQQWWNSLTPEEKEQALKREREFDEKLTRVFWIFVVGLVLGFGTYYGVEAYRWILNK